MMSAISFEQILTLAYDSLRLKLNLSIQLLPSISSVLVSYRFKNTFEELVSIFRINLNKIGEFLFCASHYIHKVLFNMCQINTRVFVTRNVLYVGITDLNETATKQN
jgi:hypothetical protein